jgi:transcriptional regulator with XRE-family HTH domain
MLIGDRLRILREAKGLSQGDIEKAAGVRRCYVSRVENDHTTPTIETLEKWAKALDIPLYAIFYEMKPPMEAFSEESTAPMESSKDRKFVQRLRKSLARMEAEDRELLFRFALILSKQRQAGGRRGGGSKSIVLKKERGIATVSQ